MSKYTADQLVGTYIQLRNTMSERGEKFDTTGATEAEKQLIFDLKSVASKLAREQLATTADVEAVEAGIRLLESLLVPQAIYKKSMTAIEAMADQMMKETGQTALKTEHGTAYYNPFLSVKCADRELFFNWVFEHNARNYLTAAVSKEAVKEHMDANGGHPPPGISVETFIKVQFRVS